VAADYFYRSASETGGPVAFRDLVRLVREGRLTADDEVLPEWEVAWKPAASLVGLFYMAGRADLLAEWEAEQRLATSESELLTKNGSAPAVEQIPGSGSEIEFDEILAAAEEAPSWRRRLHEVASLKFLRESTEEARQERHAKRLRTRIRDAISSAVAAADQRADAARPGRVRRFLGAARSPEIVHGVFRWGSSIMAANAAALAIMSWSEAEALRYPDREPEQRQVQVFPIWGPCSSGIYGFLMADAMVFAGTAGFLGARILEGFTDD